MARRKDHTRDELKDMLRQTAEKIIKTKGIEHLTARALATQIGYSPGTLYNIYPDMEGLKQDINFHTLGRLLGACQNAVTAAPPGPASMRALAKAYLDFAQAEPRLWSMIFTDTRDSSGTTQLPGPYRERLDALFAVIEKALHDNASIPPKQRGLTARLLWSCLHGIAVLTLDGRLRLVGAHDPAPMIDMLIERFTPAKG